MTLFINGKTYEADELIAYVKKLEKENTELKRHIKADCIDCADYYKNKRLEKENAELKEKLGDVQMQKAGEKSDLVWKLMTANEQKADQLTKAKEIIKYLCGMV